MLAREQSCENRPGPVDMGAPCHSHRMLPRLRGSSEAIEGQSGPQWGNRGLQKLPCAESHVEQFPQTLS